MDRINFFNPIFAPYRKNEMIWYEANFLSLNHIYDYLKSNPKPNTRIFDELASREGTFRFAGAPYEDALKYLKDGYIVNYDNILESLGNLNQNLPRKTPVIEKVYSYAGGRVDTRRFVMGAPKHMVRTVYIEEPKFITIDFLLSYPHFTTKAQVENRGIITINLIKLLELNGYNVMLNTFELSEEGNEVVLIKVMTKKGSGLTDINKILYATISVELFRRCFFAIKETLPVQRNWGSGYGVSTETDRARKLLDTEKEPNYILIGRPSEHGIEGDDIYEDAERFFKSIDLDKYVKVKTR